MVEPTADTVDTERNMLINLLDEESGELVEAWVTGDVVELADGIADTFVILLNIANRAGIDLEPVMAEVLRSNDSKINWADGEPWVTRDDGKVLKDHHFSPAEISEVLALQTVRFEQ